jgi:hypothetical protein
MTTATIDEWILWMAAIALAVTAAIARYTVVGFT